jgi:hypothetical protein
MIQKEPEKFNRLPRLQTAGLALTNLVKHTRFPYPPAGVELSGRKGGSGSPPPA